MTSSDLPIRNVDQVDGNLNLDFLIIGAGPAGASLACFLGKYGVFSRSLALFKHICLNTFYRIQRFDHQLRPIDGEYSTSTHSQPARFG